MNTNIQNICKNFKSIIECEFLDDDVFSHKLVNYYKSFVTSVDLNNPNAVKRAQDLDITVKRYIDDYKFSKKLRDTIDVSTVVADNFTYLNEFFDYIVLFCNEYNCVNEVVVQTKWI